MAASGDAEPRISPRIVFLQRFSRLYEAAGNPKLEALSRATGRLPGHGEAVPIQRISDWRTGRAIPARWETFEPVLSVLRRYVRESGRPAAPELMNEQQWKWLWDRCIRERRDATASTRCPYPGLTEYRQTDFELFSGREQATTELLTLIDSNEGQLVALVGASDAGKSSLVAAGVAAALETRNWSIRTVTPSRTSAHDLTNIVWGEEEHRLLVVDQFEELFTSRESDRERTEFLATLDSLRAQDGPPTTVIIAVRADFYARCMEYPALLDTLAERSYLLGPMNRGELTRAVTRPAEVAGCTLENGLLELIINDLCGMGEGADATERRTYDPSLLPLLSHVMAATWRHRKGRKPTLAGYREAGGVRGSVTTTAETAWAELTETQRAAAKNILLALVNAGRDTKDTRRIASRDEIASTTTEADVVLDVLATSRLVTLEKDTAYLTHEIVLDDWRRLRDWIDEDRVGVLERQRVNTDAADWSRAGRPASRLYSTSRLVEIRNQVGDSGSGTPAAEFPAAAEAERDRRDRRAHRLKVAAALTAVVVLILAGLFYWKSNQAGQNSALAAQRSTDELVASLLSKAEGMEGSDPSLSAQLVMAAYRLRAADPDIASRLLRFQTLPLATTLSGHGNRVNQVAISPDGVLLASAGSDAKVLLREIADPAHAAAIPESFSAPISSVAFSPQGRILAVGTEGRLRLWDVSNPLHPNAFGPAVESGTKAVHLAFSPDGRTLARTHPNPSAHPCAMAQPGASTRWAPASPEPCRPRPPQTLRTVDRGGGRGGPQWRCHLRARNRVPARHRHQGPDAGPGLGCDTRRAPHLRPHHHRPDPRTLA
ncbi:hypothetical protein [Nocardia sp. SYP-A9097]|uniref:nSTAND1 domain-containing NTPase n=1 Tax=Nocardia sp. SYP-A9097 TaxID=2663237 RepID=UPI0018919A84|nr:hypothetical protein [Nocardia sp. SYP-A9097]